MLRKGEKEHGRVENRASVLDNTQIKHGRQKREKALTRIQNEMQYQSAMERIEELLKIVNNETPVEDRYSVELALLSDLVAD